MQVGGTTSPFLKPVQIMAVQQDPLDSHVIFTADGASNLLKSWSVNVTDEQGNMQHFGPYTTDQASVPGKTILGSKAQGNYKIVMVAKQKRPCRRKESTVRLMKADDAKQEGLRYSILFDFDKSKSVVAYEKFLTEVVTPLITDNSTVIIHGHTDVMAMKSIIIPCRMKGRWVRSKLLKKPYPIRAGKGYYLRPMDLVRIPAWRLLKMAFRKNAFITGP
jgi:outer membrane protein OmpA-like peptidoglycan-associated protein